jgi:hypothetical protein
VNETNQYATLRTRDSELPGGVDWKLFTVAEFKAWFAIWLYMEIKKQLNMKTYWMKEGSVFHCPIVSKVMSRNGFNALIRFFHIINPTYI